MTTQKRKYGKYYVSIRGENCIPIEKPSTTEWLEQNPHWLEMTENNWIWIDSYYFLCLFFVYVDSPMCEQQTQCSEPLLVIHRQPESIWNLAASFGSLIRSQGTFFFGRTELFINPLSLFNEQFKFLKMHFLNLNHPSESYRE